MKIRSWLRRTRAVHAALVGCVSLVACDELPSLYINLEGSYVADGGERALFEQFFTVPDSGGVSLDTLARLSITELRFEFVDLYPDPEIWDHATLVSVVVCEPISSLLACGGPVRDTTIVEQVHRFRSTPHTLALRSNDYGPAPWARTSWLGDRAAFEVLLSGPAGDSSRIRFARSSSDASNR